MSEVLYVYYKKWGNNIYIRYKGKDGKETKTKIYKEYKPTLFIESQEETEHKSIFGYSLKPTQFHNIKEAADFAAMYDDVHDFVLEGNSDFANQFIIELLNGQSPKFDTESIRVGILDIEVDAPEFPEPEQHRYPITAITVYDNFTDKYYVFGLEHDKQTFINRLEEQHGIKIKPSDIVYKSYTEEHALLKDFLIFMNAMSFDLTSGWNSEEFDMPYIVLRCEEVVSEKFTANMLSPFGKINRYEATSKYNKKFTKIDIIGLPHLDYEILYRKHVGTFEPKPEYNLNYISSVEVDEVKLSYEEEGSLRDLYKKDYSKYIAYNIKDVFLIKKIDDKHKLFELTYAMAYYALCNFEDTLGTVKIWEMIIAKHLFNTGRVPLYKQKYKGYYDIEGGYVKEPAKGLLRWITSFDLSSLYPHIEMQYNIGIDTHVARRDLPEELRCLKEKYTVDDIVNKRIDLSILDKYDYAMTANFEFYRKDKMSFFSEIKRELYNNRKSVKNEMLDVEKRIEKDKTDKTLKALHSKFKNMQKGIKILLNGGYGALANKHFIYFMIENAEAITKSGQLINRWTGEGMNVFLNKIFKTEGVDYWVYADTDSGYYDISRFVDNLPEMEMQKKIDIIDRFCEEVLQVKIDRLAVEMCGYVHGYEQKMEWKREVIAEKAFWTAKKFYAMNVWDSEGVRYQEPKLKMQGLEAVKASSVPAWSRKYLKQAYSTILSKDNDSLHILLDGFRKEFYSFDVNDIAVPRGVNHVQKYTHTDKNIMFMPKAQPHVKGSILHNHLVDEMGLKHIKKITDGSKIKFVPLRTPNPTGKEVIAFQSYLPKEFELEKYINKDAVFDSAFMDPLKRVLDSIGWQSERMVTFD